MELKHVANSADGAPPQDAVLRRVLFAEDDPALREMIAGELTCSGYEVVACANGREALAALELQSFDAVLSDIGMPGMDGLALLRCVRERDLDVPVVLLTGGPSLETAVEAVTQGALQYLTKPVPLSTLLEVVERAVRLGTLARLKREALMNLGLDDLLGDSAGLAAAFERALASLRLDCQPIVHAADGRLHGYEALLRTDELLFPSPGALITGGERLGRLAELGAAIRAEAARMLDSGAVPEGLFLFVNLHPHDLADDAVGDPAAPLSRHATRVVLEITERAPLDNVPGIAARIHRLRALGFRIALDDLGAGHAGLNSLSVLAPDIVKFDIGLVRNLDRDRVKQKLVVSMTKVCRELGITVVAEGIETTGERDAARAARCDLLQGYLLGRPGPLPVG